LPGWGVQLTSTLRDVPLRWAFANQSVTGVADVELALIRDNREVRGSYQAHSAKSNLGELMPFATQSAGRFVYDTESEALQVSAMVFGSRAQSFFAGVWQGHDLFDERMRSHSGWALVRSGRDNPLARLLTDLRLRGRAQAWYANLPQTEESGVLALDNLE